MSNDSDNPTGNASSFTLSASNSASWNPALRPNGHARNTSTASNDDFFERYPGPTPEKSRTQAQETVAEEPEDMEAQSPSRKCGLSVNHPEVASPEILVARPDEGDGKVGESEQDQEAPIFKPQDSAQKQGLALNTDLALPTRQPVFIGTPGMYTPTDLERELDVDMEGGSNYEHQGEVSDLESSVSDRPAVDLLSAVDESPDAPLLDDEEPPPTIETLPPRQAIRAVSGESMADYDGAAAPGQPLPKAMPHPGQIDRSFTTNFTEMPTASEPEAEAPLEPEVPVSNEWPSAGDDKTFGELLGDNNLNLGETEQTPIRATHVDDVWGTTTEDDAFDGLLGNETQPEHQSTAVPFAQPEESATLDAPVTAPEGKEEDLAAMWQAALDDDDLLDESNDLDPSSFFDDDDPGFLEDELLPPAPTPASQTQTERPKAANSYIPTNPTQPAQSSQYAAPGPQMVGSAHARSAATPSTGLFDLYGQGAISQQQHAPRPSLQSTQSFVDKAKGGYQSPYDLPMDVVKPKQRPRPAATVSQIGSMPTPPQRTSSMSSQFGQPVQPPTGTLGVDLTPPSSRAGPPSSAAPPVAANGGPSAKSTPKTNSGFFEDLPLAQKARARPSGAYMPSAAPTPINQMPPQLGRAVTGPPVLPPPQQQAPQFAGLTRQPERLPLLPDQPTAPVPQSQSTVPPPNQRYSPSSLPAPIQSQNRFSPAPPTQTAPPAGSTSRYSPAPTSQTVQGKKYSISGPSGPTPPGVQHAHPFAPRTSSPLAFQTEKPTTAIQSSPPKTNGTRSPGTMSPAHSYSPIDQRTSGFASLTSPPQRPMTQSPPAVMKMPRYPSAQVDQVNSISSTQTTRLPHRRQFSMELGFAPPNDERIHDPLERWKGHPIFSWGESGTILSSFPKHTPFYGAGGSPSLKCTPGAVNVLQASSFMPMDDRNAKFPGPLTSRAKGRKKEVVGWMSSKIEDLEKHAELVRNDFQTDLDTKKRADERVILWKLMKIFVEHDGHLEGDKKIDDEVRAVLLPNLAQMGQVTELQSPISSGPGIQADAVDKSTVLQLRQALMEGQREKAVWLAEEKKLWGHAMLIASTMSPEVWKQIIQSFVRSQVKTIGSDARSLAALYQVFAGNAEECMDELVPPSARAGFQMISKSDGATARDPLEGLDQWRETLGLVAGNRTHSDGSSLLALGKLLGDYGRAEAAHSCFLFARQQAKHTGADDAEVSFVLLGADHKTKAESFANNLDAIILTEIYEWASSLSAPNTAVHYIPHLQSFKLIHAQELAACGLKSKAQAYCDHITIAYTSTTRPSPYYHPTFTQAVNDLIAFLAQTPQSGSGSLLSKGAMNKVSSNAASWFTKFIAGDDDQESNGSAPGAGNDDMASGPFGKVNGDSPVLSRAPSVTELYNPASMATGGIPYGSARGTPPQQFAPSSGPSKYAPMSGANKYAPMTSGAMATSFQRAESPRRPASARNYAPTSAAQSLGVPRPDTSRSVSEYIPSATDSRINSAQDPGLQGSYEPHPSLAEDTPLYGYQPMVPSQGEETHIAATPSYQHMGQEQAGIEAEDGGYQPATGYEPPSTSYGGYEPPSYQPYEPEPEAEEEPAPKKKGMMDDDDDDELAKRAAAIQKANADRAADEAFRKAAEEDAERDKSKAGAGKKGWLGGWFAGKKEQDMPTVHRAKLGEESSFYYDENLKKWVNKKGGPEAATPAAATPPPPRTGPSRATSGAMGPPSGPPSRSASGIALPGSTGLRSTPAGRPPSLGGMPPMGPPSMPSSRSGTPALGDGPAGVNGSGPPSRPPTSMSNASSLDDLLGGPPGPGQRKAGGTAKSKKKGGRYVDVMQAK